MDRFCDLHTHSHFSDGTFSPAQLLAAAREANLTAIALCDHNTVLGLLEFLAAAKEYDVEAIPGAEFSTDYQGTELHILGLFIRPEYFETVTGLMDEAQQRKERSNRELIEALSRAGYPMDLERIKSKTPKGQINRSHIAAELTELGYTATRQEAFSKLLSPKCGYYNPPERISAFQMIERIKSMGAVAVLAHPFLNLKEEATLRGFLGSAKDAGLDGMEVLYPLFDAEKTRLAAELAKVLGLLPTGGSDFHGANKPDIRIGKGKGELAVPESFLDGLKKAVGRH